MQDWSQSVSKQAWSKSLLDKDQAGTNTFTIESLDTREPEDEKPHCWSCLMRSVCRYSKMKSI